MTLAALAVGAALVALLAGVWNFSIPGGPSVDYFCRCNPMAETDRQQFPPEPRLETHPAMEMQELHTQEDRILNTYGWTNKPLGIVRIPIDQAMQMQLQRGFPTQSAKQAAKK